MELLVRQTGDQLAGSTLQMLDGFREQIGEEMDLRNEARSLVHFRRLQNEFDLTKMAVPEPYPEHSGRNVLTMEFFDGVPIDDLAQVAELGVDPMPLVQEVMRAFFLTTVRWGAFHGDVHAGNMMLLRDGRIGVIDWGIVGRLDPSTHRFFISLLSAAMGNEAAWTDVTAAHHQHLRAGHRRGGGHVRRPSSPASSAASWSRRSPGPSARSAWPR